MMRLGTGGDIDRSRPLRFTFDGRVMSGFAGDTLASALLANGVSLVARSFKYHRPRGIYSAGVEEPNALISVGQGAARIPNLQATMVELTEGLVVTSQNRWPSLRFDIQALNQLGSRFMGAGFYYKTFMGPVRGAWMFYERIIRRAAGLGMPPTGSAPRALARHIHCDTLVIGAGLAGLTAALEAAKSGQSVVLAEQEFRAGGQALSSAAGSDERRELTRLSAAVMQYSGIQFLPRTQVFGAYDHGVFGLIETGPREVFHHVVAKNSIVATGAHERGIAIAGNDRPGVMLASAARTYLNRYGVLCGKSIVVVANNDAGIAAAIDLAMSSAKVTLVDVRPQLRPAQCDSMTRAGVTFHINETVTEIIGRGRVRGVMLGNKTRLTADLVCLSGGWSPVVHLTSHLGHKPVWSAPHLAFLPGSRPGQLPENMRVTGAAAGNYRAIPLADDKPETDWQTPIKPFWTGGSAATAFVDLQNDVTHKDIKQAHDEGFVSVEHLKRYTTLGMGTDQGRISNVTGLALMAAQSGTSIPETGTTTFRAPFSAVSLGALAGDATGADFHMRRRSPLHDENLRDGAEMIHSGLWERAWYYRENGPDVDQASIAEMKLVRSHAALCDVSSLGKIDIEGPDAGSFLNRLYTNPFGKLPVGRARWGVMLRDDGFVFDDGTTSRLSEHRYFMTTTTAKAGQVLARMEFLLETAWRDLRVHVTPVTDHWAAMALAGPAARDILGRVVGAGQVCDDALPFLGVREARISDVPVRLLRVSFSGEMSYEIYAPAHDAPAIWRALRNAGAGLEGLEALGALRIEKGHISGGEFENSATMGDLGLGTMISTKKQFVGQVMAARDGLNAPGRLQLVGLVAEGDKPLSTGAILSFDRFRGTGDGRVTSATWSPTLGKNIALALVRDGSSRIGEKIRVLNPARGVTTNAELCCPHFLDPKGERMRG